MIAFFYLSFENHLTLGVSVWWQGGRTGGEKKSVKKRKMKNLWNEFLYSLGIIKKKVNILFLGLDNAGKTTILNHLKLEKVRDTKF